MKNRDQLAPYVWAILELGQSEIFGSQDNPRIIFYHSFTDYGAKDDETPWCSSFMCAAHEETGHKSTRSAAAISWATWGIPGDGKIGDIAVFRRKGGHHVAFVHIDVDKASKFVMVLGGNQANKVCVETYRIEDLICFRRLP
jgi:uncharacterized protein (TIGR02594 family)